MSEMSVCIATIIDERNYGNRLQNFALQRALQDLGIVSVATIPNDQGTWNYIREPARTLGILRTDGLDAISASLRRRLGKQEDRSVDSIGGRAMRRFDMEQVHFAPAAFTRNSGYADLASKWDKWVVGSDQVWHPSYGLGRGLAFLSFADQRQRIAYSASFGVDSVPRHLRRKYGSGIAGIPHISVREGSAASLVRELTNRVVPVTLDPTMLLDARTWRELATAPQPRPTKGYVLAFMLGDQWGHSYPEPFTAYARKHDLEIVELPDPAKPGSEIMSPLDFVGSIMRANLLLTNSFHATVFAILLNVPFLLLPRGAMNSRLRTLLSTSGLPYPNAMLPESIRIVLDQDWSDVSARLSSARTASLDFLSSALSDSSPVPPS